MPAYQYKLPPAIGSTRPFARNGRAFPQPMISIWLAGPSSIQEVQTVLDSGAECCLFPEWVAWRVGLRQAPVSPQLSIVSSVSLAGVATWFATVELELRDPARSHAPFRWTSFVGFTGRGSFSKSSASGILGVNGGLDHLQRVEFDWQALGGPEVVIRT